MVQLHSTNLKRKLLLHPLRSNVIAVSMKRYQLQTLQTNRTQSIIKFLSQTM